MSAPLLEVRNLSAAHGKKPCLHGIDLSLMPGELLLVLGHNGAGKTTLMRTIFGLHRPSAGQILYQGRDIVGRRPAENVAAGIAYVPQGHGVFRSLSVRDNLLLGAFVVTDRARLAPRLDVVFGLFPVLKERERQIGGTLSGGQQQMLAIGMALMHEPAAIILDEPSLGLAPNLVERVMETVVGIKTAFSTSIIMVEQNVRLSLPVADRVAVIKTGRKIYDGDPGPLGDKVELMKLF